MSFSLTERQYCDRTKDVTRRLGWKNLKPGDVVIAVRKAMGLRKGEKHHILGRFVVVSNDSEPVSKVGSYPADETAREGFPELTAAEFVAMFCKNMGCRPSKVIQRIVFKHLED